MIRLKGLNGFNNICSEILQIGIDGIADAFPKALGFEAEKFAVAIFNYMLANKPFYGILSTHYDGRG